MTSELESKRTGISRPGIRVSRPAVLAIAWTVLAWGHPPGVAAQAAESEAGESAAGDSVTAVSSTGAVGTLEDLAWIAGRWRGEGPNGSLNETWIMAPRAGLMAGAMRLTDGDEILMQEMIAIAEDDGGVEMRIRHFDRDLVALEEEPIVLSLVEVTSGRAVFEGSYGESTIRSIMETRPSGGWTGRSEITDPDGARRVIEGEMEPFDEGGRVRDTSYRTADGIRILRQEIVVPAPPEALWPLFSTAEGFESWAVPHAWMDFRVGGTIETSYREGAERGHPHNIRNRILSYVPARMLSIQPVQAPPDFPTPEVLDEIFFVLELEPVAGGGTRVVESGLGFRDGEPYRTVEELFRRGNEWTLERLYERARELEGEPATDGDGR